MLIVDGADLGGQRGTNAGAPSAGSDLVTKDYADALAPAGQITMYGGAAAPAGYLLCDGSSYLRATYPALFAAIGTSYGTVDGTHFTVPDLRGRFPLGASAGTYARGDLGGSLSHTHGLSAAWAKISAAGSNIGQFRAVIASWTANIQAAATVVSSTLTENTGTGLGGNTDGGDHTPPYAVVNYIIKT